LTFRKKARFRGLLVAALQSQDITVPIYATKLSALAQGDVDEPGLTSNSLSLARIEGCVKENTLQNQLSMAS
jgi:hypothetical protein